MPELQNAPAVPSPVRWNRLMRDGNLYAVGCICLLLVAAGLRFYDLSGNSLWLDEAVAANNSRGSFSETLGNTASRNSSPILYPLILWVIQKVESSPFSVRMVPAAASVLTVAMLLFLLPRVGVSRWTAFIAGLLATLSAEAIRQAQGVRVYSVDAFVTVLMIIGLLSYLRIGGGQRKSALLCVSLFIGPLVQYGVVLFGLALFGTILVVEGRTIWHIRQDLRSCKDRIWNEIRDLFWPAASFTAGSVLTYVTLLRYQWCPGGFGGSSYLSGGYFSAGWSDMRALLEFGILKTWVLFDAHMPEVFYLDFSFLPQTLPRYYKPEVFAITAFVGFGLFLIVPRFRKARFDAIPILFLFSIAIALTAGLLRVYPYGGGRHSLYLGPILFLTYAHVLRLMAESLSRLASRPWLSHVTMSLVGAIVVFGGINAIDHAKPYQEYDSFKSILAALDELEQEGDVVWVSSEAVPAMRFYRWEKPDNYHYDGGCGVRTTVEECIEEVLKAVDELPSDRLWFVFSHQKRPGFDLLESLQDGIRVERVVDKRLSDLYLLEAPSLFDLLGQPRGGIKVSGDRIIDSDFQVYLSANRLIYVKEPCRPSDVAPHFFLHINPRYREDLPHERRQYNFDNLDFSFYMFGTMHSGQCAAIRALPEYDIDSLSTGQFIRGEGKVWAGSFSIPRQPAVKGWNAGEKTDR